ncbi:MAG: hypothetical protein WAU48_10220 [Gammaproteobacteria bacterium]
MSGDLSRPWRVPLLILGMVSLFGGAAEGLLRLGWNVPLPGTASVLDHGPLMIGAFFGTVISLERAVALGARWAYSAPLFAGLGGIALLAGFGNVAGPALLCVGSVFMVAGSLQVYRRQRALHTLTLLLGAASWATGNALWLAGFQIYAIAPLWMAFLILTIAGERLELSRFLPPSPVASKVFAVIVALLLAGTLAAFSNLPKAGLLFPATLLALAAWLLKQDIARRTVHQKGLTRFIAVCLLSGYVWLSIGALILLSTGGIVPNSAAYGAGLHAILLGFVFAMVFGHAPIIFPAILSVRMPYHPLFYVPLLVLHLSLVLRVAGTMMGEAQMRSMGGALNAVALALFVLGVVSSVVRGASDSGRSAGR